MAAALRDWEAERFEAAGGERGLIAAMMRSPAEWRAHPQGRAVAELPPFELERIGDAPPETLPASDRPLTGVRVLDLTRIIAGPVCGRALAAHGADVLRITAPHLPFVETLVMDNGRGKLSAHADLRTRRGADTLRGLVRSAHVFVQGYRPGSMEKLGFGAEEVAAMRSGIVYVSLSAYGCRGPWRERRGLRLDRTDRKRDRFRGGPRDGERRPPAPPLPGAGPRLRVPHGARGGSPAS